MIYTDIVIADIYSIHLGHIIFRAGTPERVLGLNSGSGMVPQGTKGRDGAGTLFQSGEKKRQTREKCGGRM